MPAPESAPPAPDRTLARLAGVTHRYGEVVALESFDLEVRAGEVLAVLGPNGAGKTTAIRLLLGALPVQEGQVRVFGGAPGSPEARRRRGAMLQTSGVPEALTVREHLELFTAYYPAPLPVERLLALAGLDEIAERRFGALSGGQKQRLFFALALAGDPELVFLDEPTAGLDLDGRLRLWDEIRRLREAGRAAVLTTHYLEEADALADRVAVVHRGALIAEGKPAEIKTRVAGRVVRCSTRLGEEEAKSLPGVVRVSRRGRRLALLTSQPEAALRRMFALDPDLGDLTVEGAGLEEVFLTLTRDGAPPESR